MKNLNRRDFLSLAALAAAGVSLPRELQAVLPENLRTLRFPDWVEPQIQATYRRFLAWKGADEAFTVPVTTDLHCYKKEIADPVCWSDSQMHVLFAERAADVFGSDLLADLGDLGFDVVGNWPNRSDAAHAHSRLASQVRLYAHGTRPRISCVGNHDHGNKNVFVSSAEFGELFNRPVAAVHPNVHLGSDADYGYVDFPAKRIRVLFLNTSDCTTGAYGISEAQLDFLKRALDETPRDWYVMSFCHLCLQPEMGRWQPVKPGELASGKRRGWPSGQARACAAAVDLFERFAAERPGRFVGAFYGDSHFDNELTENGVPHFVLQGYGGANPDAVTPGGVMQRFARDRMQLVDVVAVKPKTGEMRVFRIGQGDAARDRGAARPIVTRTLRAEMKKAVKDGLYAGFVVGSNRVPPILCEGHQTLDDRHLRMFPHSVFDLASVGKTQTAALCALLAAEGKLDPDAPFTAYIADHELAKENCRITVRDLATHSGGFDNAKPYRLADPAKMFAALYAKRPVWPRGTRFCYACSNMVYLGLIVEKLTGLDLDAAAKRLLWGPLGMTRTTWNPVPDDGGVVEFPPSTYEKWEGKPRRIGEHNDICCHLAPRPMGNGSCFSTCGDMLKFATDLLRREKFPKAYYDLLFAESFRKDAVRRTFGFAMPASAYFSERAIAHGGWTGPYLLVDPARDFAGVVMGNRTGARDPAYSSRERLMERLCQCADKGVCCNADMVKGTGDK